jgi:hypothetical protein
MVVASSSRKVRRRDIAPGLAVALPTTAFLFAATLVGYPPDDLRLLAARGGWTVALATVCCGAVAAGLLRLLSGRAASRNQWLYRYSAGVALLLILTAIFPPAGSDIDTCGTLVNPNPRAAKIDVNIVTDCVTVAHTPLLYAATWVAIVCVTAAVYGLLLRRQRNVSRD